MKRLNLKPEHKETLKWAARVLATVLVTGAAEAYKQHAKKQAAKK